LQNKVAIDSHLGGFLKNHWKLFEVSAVPTTTKNQRTYLI